MLKFWSAPSDQTTPKPVNNVDRNPFEASVTNRHLLAPSMTVPDISADLTPRLPGLNPPATPNFDAATTGLSIHAPDFHIMQPPAPKNKPHHTPTSGPSRGQIHVKLIQARNLNVSSSQARPYVVVQFEQNEFVSRDPTDESDREVKGIPTNLSRNSSSNALYALNVIGTRASLELSKRNGATTPRAPAPPSPTSLFPPSSPIGGPRSAHNPVWKHEVSLYVTYSINLSLHLSNIFTPVMSQPNNPPSHVTFTIAQTRAIILSWARFKSSLVSYTILQWTTGTGQLCNTVRVAMYVLTI